MQTLLYNKNKHVSGRKIDDMLLQLRQLINQQSIRKSPNKLSSTKYEPKTSSQTKNIQSLIQQSSRLIQKNKKSKTIKPSVRGKILAASQILKDENQLIKSYVRDKIESQIFSSRIQEQRNSLLQEQKQRIIRLKEIQAKRQNQNRKKIIQNIKQFNNYDSRVKVSIHQIDSLIYKEEPNSSYLLSLQNGKKVASNSNQIKNSNLFFQMNQHQNQQEFTNNNPNPRTKSNTSIKQKSAKNLKSKSQHLQSQFDEQFKQITQEPQGYQKFSHLETTNQRAISLNKVLQKYPHLVKIFYTFLKNQIKINSLDSSFKLMPKILIDQINALKEQTNQVQGDKFFWKCNKVKKSSKNNALNIKDIPNISSIAQNYRFKGFGINEDAKVQFQRKKISERRINKMIGDSKNFHPKKCILTKCQLIYYQQKDKVHQSSSSMLQMCLPQDIKKIQFQTQRIQANKFSKQQGSFFSKKQIEIQLIDLKGKNRGIKFEKNFLQGEQLVSDLRRLMANKVYRQGCILKGVNNINLYQFINNPTAKKFQLSTQIITPTNSTQENNIFLLSDIASARQQVQQLKINQVKISFAINEQIFKQSRQFNKLKIIQVSHVKLNNQHFLMLCKFVNQLNAKSELDVILKDNKLDDQCFGSNVGPFTSFCSKIRLLDISQNNISSKTIQIIKNCLESVTATIKHLKINNCPIMDFMKVNILIKEARKLQVLDAKGCGFDLDLINENQFERLFDFLKKCCPTFKKLNIAKNGSISPKHYAIIQKMWMLQSIESIQIDFYYKQYLIGQKQLPSIKAQSQIKLLSHPSLNIEVKRDL